MIGFDIGGTKCSVCIGVGEAKDVRIIDKKTIPTDLSVSPYEMIDRLCALAAEMTDDFRRIGISCGGPLDGRSGIIQSPPNLPGWDNVKIVEHLKRKYGGIVRLENDANACALAEWRFGAGRGCDNMVFLTFGTGMGAGLILNGRLYAGTNGNAGELGHMRMERFGPVGYGKEGSFEGFVSGGGIAQLAKNAALAHLQRGQTTAFCRSIHDLPGITAETVAIAANAGDPTAIQVYETCGEMLGRGLAVLMDLLNPQKIVIGSIFSRCTSLLETAMWRTLKQEALPTSLKNLEIVPAALGEMLGDYAALALVCGNVQEENL